MLMTAATAREDGLKHSTLIPAHAIC